MRRLAVIVGAVALLGLATISVDASPATGACVNGCYLMNYWNEDGVDYRSKVATCINVANTAPYESALCPAQNNLGGVCGGADDIQRTTTDICRCCSSAGLRAQNMACPGGMPEMYISSVNCNGGKT